MSNSDKQLRRLVDFPDEEVAPAFFRLMANGLDPPERPVDLPFVATLRAVADEYVRAPLDRPMLRRSSFRCCWSWVAQARPA